MKYHVIMEPRARREVERAYEYIHARAPLNADRWYNRLVQALESLSSLPFRRARAPEAESSGRDIRQLIYGAYRILDVVEDDEVHVLHMRHAARERWNPLDAEEDRDDE